MGGAGLPHVLYLAHDLDDGAVWRRLRMLEVGGATVTVAGFRRGQGPLPHAAIELGRTENGRMAHRILAVAAARPALAARLRGIAPPDVVLARNLEMLSLAGPVQRLWPDRRARLVYEVLDIHRLMIGESVAPRLLRAAERRLGRDVDLCLTSSPGFVRNYFAPHCLFEDRIRIVENKALDAPPPAPAPTGPLAIGWFGILRCRWSLDMLDGLTRAAPGRYRVVLRGRPALDVLPDFHEVVAGNPDLCFGGPYRYPEDLAAIYGEVRITWLPDRYDQGANSDWLLPNRLYEGGQQGRVPLALAGTESAAFLARLGIGLRLEAPSIEALRVLLDPLTTADLDRLGAAVRAVPASTWTASEEECRNLVSDLCGSAAAPKPVRSLEAAS